MLKHNVELAVVIDGVITYKNNITKNIDFLFNRIEDGVHYSEKFKRDAKEITALVGVAYANDLAIDAINDYTLGDRVLCEVYDSLNEEINSLQLENTVDPVDEKFLFIMESYTAPQKIIKTIKSRNPQEALKEFNKQHIGISCEGLDNIESIIKDAARDNFSLVVVNERLEIVFQAD